MIIFYSIIILIIILGILCSRNYRKHDISLLKSQDHPLILLYPIGFKLLDKFKYTKNLGTDKYLEYIKKLSIIILMLTGICMLCILSISTQSQDSIINNKYITRPQDESNKQILNVYKDDEKVPYEVELSISPKQLSIEELNKKFEMAYDYLLNNILGDNKSLDHITQDLNLITDLSDYDMTVEWYSSDNDIVNYDGKVSNLDFEDNHIEFKTIILNAILLYDENKSEFQIEVVVLPKPLSDDERFINSIKKAVQESDRSSPNQDSVSLPEAVNGSKVKYEVPGEKSSTPIIVIVGLIMTVSLLYGIDKQKKRENFIREKQLRYDYSEVISKLTVLTGAGMTIAKAWEKISIDYKNKREQNNFIKHHVYEEMLITYYQLKSGVSETKAYIEFGRRCNIKEYLKLGALLEQNLKKGTKGLAQMLENESIQAFGERKILARKLGEEASTKLLLPMCIMLIIVMIIVIVPALLSFHI